MSTENLNKFMSLFSDSLRDNTFVKATLGNYQGKDSQLQRLLVRRIKTKKGDRISVLHRYKTRDLAKNHGIQNGLDLIREKLDNEFFAGHLFTTKADYQLDLGKKGKSHLNRSKPTFRSLPDQSHDREKRRIINQDSLYLQALGITNDSGSIKPKQQHKWKQINKFVEILGALIDDSKIDQAKPMTLLDMGSGKGYLTFAAFDYLRNIRNLELTATGIDSNQILVDFCNETARAAEFAQLSFRSGTISTAEIGTPDILIALHACDTATDDALFAGISSGASLIVASPCCHREIRPQITPPPAFAELLSHGTLLERQAELITDGIRALLLKKEGYETKVFEFVPFEHTPKNTLITAVRMTSAQDPGALKKQIADMKSEFGINSQRLEYLLENVH